MILAYSDYIEDTLTKWTGNGKRGPNSPKLFFSKRGVCPFCKVEASLVFESLFGEPHTLKRAWGTDKVWSCKLCGWWEIQTESTMDLIEEINWHLTLKHAIVAAYDPADIKLPVQVLRNELNKRPQIIYDIHPSKLEELVQSVFADFFDCKVEHCGRSNDGGVDLVLVNSDHPTLVQVKRREKPMPSESVASVREFLGAMVLNQAQHGIFVTTASDYSIQAKEAASQAVTVGAVKEFRLIDLHRFLDILGIVKDEDAEAEWKKHIIHQIVPGGQKVSWF